MHFRDEYAFLSNFYPSKAVVKGMSYPTVENAYQACKTLNLEERKQFQNIPPGEAKKLGRRVTLRSDWHEKKLVIMKLLLIQKFQDPKLKKMLLETGDIKLVEENYWKDHFWGVCNGVGENHLGKLLMNVRSEIKKTL